MPMPSLKLHLVLLKVYDKQIYHPQISGTACILFVTEGKDTSASSRFVGEMFY